MQLNILIKLPADRTKTGTLELVDPITGLKLFGPVSVLGRAARNTAKAKGNPAADPLLPFGDTPTGRYRIASIVANGNGTSRPVDVYGKSGAIVMDPLDGDALQAKKNGRVGLLIHSGRHEYSSVVKATALKPTNGCIRMLDWQLDQMIDVIRGNALIFPGEVTVEIEEPGGPAGDIDESIPDPDPPPMSGTVILP